jgi:hypothetical protein
MCIRTGKQCPGPLDGPLFVDMNSSTVSRTKKQKSQQSIQKSRHPKEYSPVFPDQVMYGIVAQISQGAVFNEAFYANFLAFFVSDGEGRDLQNRQTWVHSLPTLSTDGTNNALPLALRATASAFCGAATANIAVQQDASKIYGEALQAHARELRLRPRDVTVHMVSTSVMLSLFEAMQATTASAYRQHILGAAKMIEVTGPGQCMDGVLCQLFFHIRTQMAFVYLTTQKTVRISAKKILVETLMYKRFPIFQRLMSQIATLAEIYVDKEKGNAKQQLLDLAVYSHVRSEVDALWLEYKEQAESRGEELSWVDGTGDIVYRDGFTALCIAYFAAARILFAVLAPRLAATYIDLTDHHASILNCAEYLSTMLIGCAYMRMTTPLYLVALHSPSLKQRREAITVFEQWSKGSMAGISALALDNINQRQDSHVPQEELSLIEKIPSAQHFPLSLKWFQLEDWVGQV